MYWIQKVGRLAELYNVSVTKKSANIGFDKLNYQENKTAVTFMSGNKCR